MSGTVLERKLYLSSALGDVVAQSSKLQSFDQSLAITGMPLSVLNSQDHILGTVHLLAEEWPQWSQQTSSISDWLPDSLYRFLPTLKQISADHILLDMRGRQAGAVCWRQQVKKATGMMKKILH